jgi:ankyrin repeat protein
MSDDNNDDVEAARLRATSLRCQLDHLIHRFRDDTLIDGELAPTLIEDVRVALEDEFVILLSQYSEEDLQSAVLLPYDDSKRLPLHLACDKNAPVSILKALLDADKDKVSIGEADRWGDLPLHTACSRKQAEVVKLLVDSDTTKSTLYTKADNGSLPIHTAARYDAPASVIALLLDSTESRRTLLEADIFGQLPLHAACRNGATADVVNLLLHYDEDRETVMMEDNVGRLPIHLALLHTRHQTSIEVVQLILQQMIYKRMERKGLVLWQKDVKSMLNSMQTHERDFTTRDKLDIISDAISNFKERVFTLELAVWKASCLQFDSKFQSMEDVIEHESLQMPCFDAHTYKVDRRIKSGADIIVRDVMSFLENEPVDEIIDQFKNYH